MPDDLFRQAEAAARRLRVSRSELYAKAIATFLKQQDTNTITERLNELYSHHPAKVDSRLHRTQLKSFPKDAWGSLLRKPHPGILDQSQLAAKAIPPTNKANRA